MEKLDAKLKKMNDEFVKELRRDMDNELAQIKAEFPSMLVKQTNCEEDNVKRRAILISSPLAPGAIDLTKGTEKDVSNWVSFLTSIKGGSWNLDDEIKIFKDGESKQDLFEYIDDLPKMDYILFFYSGHGFSIKNSDYIRMNKGGVEPVLIREIKQKIGEKADRASMIVDACRCEEWPISCAYPNGKMNESYQPNGNETSASWESLLRLSNKVGVVLIQSCKPNHRSSMQANNTSSLFSDMMIHAANHTERPKSILEIFSDAKDNTVNISNNVWNPPQPQEPVIDNPEANYPFSLGTHFANAMEIMKQS